MDLPSRLPTDLAPLWRAVFERLSSGHPVSRVRVGPLDDRQQSALADLLGLNKLPGRFAVVSLTKLDQILIESVGATTREVVTQLIGPPEDRAGDRARRAAQRSELWEWLNDHAALAAQPALKPWAATLRRAGLVHGSVSRTHTEITQALQVLAALPASGVPLPVLADRVLGDPHALDDGTRCSGLVLRALASIHDAAMPENAQQRRALWEKAGVANDELSAVVLAAGIRPTGGDVASQILRLCAEAGQAAALTLGQLRQGTADLKGIPADVWVVENPSVLAMALTRFDHRCPPVVVTSGWPNSAVVLLLQKLAAGGARLHYHGDLDGEGLRIAAAIVARTNAMPWRMTTADYLAAVTEGPPVGRVSEVPWDAELAGHMTRLGVTVTEERVAAGLLDELAARLSAECA